jgi:hypothetical protein
VKQVVRGLLLLVTLAALVAAQEKPAPAPPDVEFTCPMDKDVRSAGPGKCPRCGMKLTASLPEHLEYRMRLTTVPRLLEAGRPALLKFAVAHPKSGEPVAKFETVHEKLFHLFLISQDLEWFAHVHPQPGRSGEFVLPVVLPKPGAYRLAADFYPTGGTPQLLPRTFVTGGAPSDAIAAAPVLNKDLSPKQGDNVRVELKTEPAQPLAGQETLLFFDLSPDDGIEPFLGAWGHMLAASDDLIDLIHDHPLYVDGVEPPALTKPWPTRIQFNVLFPRERVYRVWVQFQRRGVVNTVSFTVPVKALR